MLFQNPILINPDPLNETSEEVLQKSLKEASYYRYALEESSIVTITVRKRIIHYVNNNFSKISKYYREEFLRQDRCIINLGYHFKSNPHVCQQS